MSEEVIPPDKSKYTNDVFVRKGTKLHNTSVKLLKAVHAYNDALRELYPGNEFLNPSRLEYLRLFSGCAACAGTRKQRNSIPP
jgi:hypothetical protein